MKNRWTITADKFLTEEQVGILLAYLERERDLSIARNKNFQAIRTYYTVRAFLETGLRCFELAALTVGDLVGHHLVVRKGKGDKARTVLLTRLTALFFQQWLEVKAKLKDCIEPGAPMFPSRYGGYPTTRAIRKRVKAALIASELPGHLSVHSLRHTYCSHLIATGRVGIATICSNMGHSSIAITDLYAHAVGTLDDRVELYTSSQSSSAIYKKSEANVELRSKKHNDSVSAFLRKRKQKKGDRSNS